MESEQRCQCGDRLEQHAIDRGYCHRCKCQKFDDRIYTQAQMDEAVANERERCAKIAERWAPETKGNPSLRIAAIIRSGVDKENQDQGKQTVEVRHFPNS